MPLYEIKISVKITKTITKYFVLYFLNLNLKNKDFEFIILDLIYYIIYNLYLFMLILGNYYLKYLWDNSNKIF